MKNKISLLKKFFVVMGLAFVFLAGTLFADVIVLTELSENTYVKSEHDEGLDFTYRGLLSIKGAERYGSRGDQYPEYSRISYVYKENVKRYYLRSKGETDSKVRTRKVEHPDSLYVFAPKTQVYGYIGLSKAVEVTPYADLENDTRS